MLSSQIDAWIKRNNVSNHIHEFLERLNELDDWDENTPICVIDVIYRLFEWNEVCFVNDLLVWSESGKVIGV